MLEKFSLEDFDSSMIPVFNNRKGSKISKKQLVRQHKVLLFLERLTFYIHVCKLPLEVPRKRKDNLNRKNCVKTG